MSRKLWGRKNSSNVQKARWALEEAGIAYEQIDAGGPFGGLDTPAYRAMNPNGYVPTYEEEGFILWESHAITRYVAETHASGTLFRKTRTPAPLPINGWIGCLPISIGPSSIFSGAIGARPKPKET